MKKLLALSVLLTLPSCGNTSNYGAGLGPLPGTPTTPAAPTCQGVGGSAQVATPKVLLKLKDDGREGWLASPSVIDLDGDGANEIVAARGGRIYVWGPTGTRKFVADTGKDRIWASPVVANFTGDSRLEIGVAARDSVFLFDAQGQPVAGFPQAWGSETRTLGAGDVDGDGRLDIVVGVRTSNADNTRDIVRAYRANGETLPGFPPVAAGASGCDFSNNSVNPCYFAGLYDQNLAIGDLDGDGKHDLVLPHDNAYASFFKGTGAAFDAHSMYRKRGKTPGVRYMLDLAEAQQGYADNEDTALQAHFTNTAPAIADIDGDGSPEIIMLGSVQNASQDRRELGVALWVMKSDASRHPAWQSPFYVAKYVVGLWDGFAANIDADALSGAGNLVGATNQVAIADIDGAKPGLEMVFAGFDGRIHAVAADKTELWSMDFAGNGRALTGGVVVGDLSGDGSPEIVFTTYSPDKGGGALFVLSAKGELLHKIGLPQRGSMTVPTLADVDGDGTVDIVVSLKDEEPQNESVWVFQVPNSKTNCLLWPTGRANDLRSGWIRR